VSCISCRFTQFEHFDAEMFVFYRDVLLENYPSLEFHNDLIYCQIFGRVVKFCKVRPYNFKQVSYFPQSVIYSVNSIHITVREM